MVMRAMETQEFAGSLQAFAGNKGGIRVHVKEFHTCEGNQRPDCSSDYLSRLEKAPTKFWPTFSICGCFLSLQEARSQLA